MLPVLGSSLIWLRCFGLSQLCPKHKKKHWQLTQQGEGAERTHQGQHGHDPPLPSSQSLIPRLSHAGIGRIEIAAFVS